ncbi:GntR family transcriptional regulator [Streptomyces sp. 2A115]|uniref:GntR family transcriptional regulator n=1 Tax=Streptomyces sp. 2A115 TaxID=3457439 RepID=UPI003FD69689
MDAERGDGGGKEFDRVLSALRAGIVDGTYPLGSLLPPQRELAREFGVSRDTLQRVLRELGGEGLIKSRQGSGSRVVERPVREQTQRRVAPRASAALGPFIDRAFEQPEVVLDVFTLTSESLDAHIRLQAERIRGGLIAPEKISLRMLLPSETLELAYPRVKHDPHDPRPQGRLHDITRRHTSSLRGMLRELQSDKLVSSIVVDIRHVPLTPPFKLYLLNGVEMLLGPYAVVERAVLLDDDTELDILDVVGLGSPLTHFAKGSDPEAAVSQWVENMQNWFDSCWNLLAE